MEKIGKPESGIRDPIQTTKTGDIKQWLPLKYVDSYGKELDRSCVEDYKLIMIVYTASW
jgi:hypothetical protein